MPFSIPLTIIRSTPEIEALIALGQKVLDSMPPLNPDRRMTMVYLKMKTKKALNCGFILVYDWESWPWGTLKHRGYLNPNNAQFRRPANEAEREEIKHLVRAQARRYKTWTELEADERAVGTPETTITKMRLTLEPNEDDKAQMRIKRVARAAQQGAATRQPTAPFVPHSASGCG